MPLYDYECKACGNQFDELIPMREREKPTKAKCIECGKKKVVQVLTQMAIGDSIRLGVTKPSSEFKDVLTKISDAHPRSELHKKLSQGRRKKGLY